MSVVTSELSLMGELVPTSKQSTKKFYSYELIEEPGSIQATKLLVAKEYVKISNNKWTILECS